MSNYTKSTNFASKDALASGNPSKIVKGTEIDTEFNNIATAVATKVDSSGALGTPSSGTLTNCTGLPVSTGVAGLGTGVATALAVNVGSAGAPVVNGGALGTPSSGTLTNATGLPLTTGVTGTLPAANGGTGLTSPGANGNVLTSNGSAWVSASPGEAYVGMRSTRFTSNGTFTIPTGITAVKVTVVGGGGGGNNKYGGTAAAVAIKYLTGLTPGNTLSVTIGAAGTGQASSTTSTGGNSSVSSGTQTITTIQANGGVTPIGNNFTPPTNATFSGADIGIEGIGTTNVAWNTPGGRDSMYGFGGHSAIYDACTTYAGKPASGYGAGGGANINGTGYNGSAGLVIFEY